MTKLRKGVPLHSEKFRAQHPAAKAFHAPQRDRTGPAPYPKPRCGMCGGKVHTRTDYRAPDEGGPEAQKLSRSHGGWWLCPACDSGAEVGMPRAA